MFHYSYLSYKKYNEIKDRNHGKLSSYPKQQVEEVRNKLTAIGIEFPVQIIKNNIRKIEKVLNVAINIYSFEIKNDTCNRYPVSISKSDNANVLNLLYYTNDEVNYHYVWIKNFNGFLHDLRSSDHKMYFCTKCMLHFYSQEKLDQHNKDYPKCIDPNQPAKVKLPAKNEAFIEFKNFKNKFKAPFVIYADFESILEKHKEEHITHRHNPCGFMLLVSVSICSNAY
jgi:hypothetical protein